GKMTAFPARILGINGGTLQVGRPADVTVIDPSFQWTVNPECFHSKSKNTPFTGRVLTGKSVLTIVGGRVVARGNEVVA
ncbi:MAG: amidohydrolase family protein, partial [Armatimonadota bacterium]